MTLGSGVLQGANLLDAAFNGANLKRVDFCDADLTGAVFTGANLDEADIRWATFELDKMMDADLSRTRIRD